MRELFLGRGGLPWLMFLRKYKQIHAAVEKVVSGVLLHVTDALAKPAKKFTATLEPQQDLHGYDNPWPGGSGKNILNPTGESGTSSGFTVTKNSDGKYVASGTSSSSSATAILAGEFSAKAGVEYTLSGCPANGGVSSYRLDVRSSASTLYKNGYLDNGSGVSFTVDEDATLYVYMRFAGNYAITGSLTFSPMIRLASITDGTFVPYSNICPITGYTGANVTRTGKNLLNDSIKYKASTTTLRIGCNDVDDGFTIHLKPGAYTLHIDFLNSVKYGAYYREKNDSTSTAIWSSSAGTDTATFTIASEGDYRFWAYHSNGVSAENVGNCQLELGSTATEYEPYSATTIPIAFPSSAGTVYGGTLNVTTGVLTVTHELWEISGDSFTRSGTTSGGIKYYGTADRPSKYVANQSSIISNQYYKTSVTGSISDKSTRMANNYLIVYDDDFDTLADAVTHFNAHPLQVVAELTTPTSYQLTPTQVELLLGENYVWADTGDSELTYLAEA